MAAIRDRDTKPERLLRSALHRAGYRFRLNRALPGRPDLTLPKYRATVFVHGCFWHRHDCPRFKWPGGPQAAFWREKLTRNAERDQQVTTALLRQGWRQLIVWECALIGPGRLALPLVIEKIDVWLAGTEQTETIAGNFDDEATHGPG